MKDLVKLLFEQGLTGITEDEHSEMTFMVNELLSQVEPEKNEPSEPENGDCCEIGADC